MKDKLLVILGPTASGKSDLAVELALQFNGEVVSADSRQVYRGLDIATGKITEEEMHGVPHHLLDVVDPRDLFSVAEYKELADKAIFDIQEREKLPILCGGTGYYIQAVVDDVLAPEVPPNPALRKELSEKTTEELLEILQDKDPQRAHEIEKENPRRLIRAIEIAEALGSVPPVEKHERFDSLQIGLRPTKEKLRERINTRIARRLDNGMVEEVAALQTQGVSHERLEEMGLEMRYIARFLHGELSREEMQQELQWKIWQYAMRQMRWFKRDERIQWFEDQNKDIFDTVQKWIDK